VHGMTINYMLAVFFENQTGQGGRKTMCDAALFWKKQTKQISKTKAAVLGSVAIGIFW
jgi:hypothetical protein